jgi:diguanylate cyclase (GGDEF)-like protein
MPNNYPFKIIRSVSSSVVSLVTITIIGFILLVLFISYSYSLFLSGLEIALHEQELESKKMLINSELMELARSRTRITSKIIDIEDYFEQDELNMELEKYAGKFSLLRQGLLSLPLTAEERSILASNDDIVPIILPAQRSAVELAMNQTPDEKILAQQLLYDVVLPGQEKLVEGLGNLISLEQERIAELTKQSNSSLLAIKKRNYRIIATSLVMAVMLSFIVILRIRKTQLDLRNAHKKLEQINVNLELKVVERTKELSKLNQKLKDLSEHDELTGLYNRRKFKNYLEDEYARTNRLGSCFSLIMVDIDYFKNYNDYYGHQKGDQCLTSVALAMNKCLPRSIDFIARYGGEEFVIILPSTNLEGAEKVAERVRKTITDLNIPHESSKVASCITISQGITVYSAEDTSRINDVIKNADKNLYTAKSTGRNRVASC